MMWVTVAFCASLFYAIAGQKASPCPEVFNYERNYQRSWDGRINLRTEEELIGIFVTVVLDQKAERLLTWFGESTNINSKQFVIRNTDYILDPGIHKTLKFTIQFNSFEIPSVTTIRLNGRAICSDRKTVKPIPIPKTAINANIPQNPTAAAQSQQDISLLDKIYKVPEDTKSKSVFSNLFEFMQPNLSKTGQNSQSINGNINGNTGNKGTNSEVPDSGKEAESVRPVHTQERTVTNPSKEIDVVDVTIQNKCGKPITTKTSTLPLHDKTSKEGNWPWHVAIYRNFQGDWKYQCGGILISDTFLITPAHCVTSNQTGQLISQNNFLVYIGTLSLKNFSPMAQISRISEISIPTEYNLQNFNNDIAVLKLENPVEFNSYVQPVCLLDKSDLRDVDVLGTVVGWGLYESKQTSEDLTETEVSIVDAQTCISSNPKFYQRYNFTSTFCAGFRSGSNVCNGDSGSGMVISKRDSNDEVTWYLRGIVSTNVPTKNKHICEPNEYVVFTDVAKHLEWVERVITAN